jgi:hypothetical protein
MHKRPLFALIQRRRPDTYLHASGKAFLTYDGRKSRCVGATTLPITLGTLTTTKNCTLCKILFQSLFWVLIMYMCQDILSRS